MKQSTKTRLRLIRQAVKRVQERRAAELPLNFNRIEPTLPDDYYM